MTENRKRTITLIRHAKSSWNNPSLSDFDRPLNKRGEGDAPRVGEVLQEAGVLFDKVLCSDARRARQTLSLLKQKLDIDEAIIEYRQNMYGASSHHLQCCVAEQPDAISSIALIGHNPGMEELVYDLAEEPVGHMSTCNVVQLVFDCESWEKLNSSRGKLIFVIRPREL